MWCRLAERTFELIAISNVCEPWGKLVVRIWQLGLLLSLAPVAHAQVATVVHLHLLEELLAAFLGALDNIGSIIDRNIHGSDERDGVDVDGHIPLACQPKS